MEFLLDSPDASCAVKREDLWSSDPKRERAQRDSSSGASLTQEDALGKRLTFVVHVHAGGEEDPGRTGSAGSPLVCVACAFLPARAGADGLFYSSQSFSGLDFSE